MPDTKPDSGRKVLFSAQRNEGPFLLEWIAYHKAIGFTDIVIVSNDCDDGSDLLLDRLHAAGEIRHIRQEVPADAAPQSNAEAVARRAGCFRDGDWVMWLDSDEFLLPGTGAGRLDDLITAAGPADAVMVAWRFFGDGGNDRWPGRHVSERFTRAAARRRGAGAQVKTLFRYGPQVARLDIHRPVLAEGVGPDGFRVITSSLQPPDPAFFDTARRRPFNRMPPGKGAYRLGQVAHFSIRTPDMFALKSRRGDGYFPMRTDFVQRNDEFYRKKNLNETEERGLLRHEAATLAEMHRLFARPGVREACEAIAHFRFPEAEKAGADHPLPLRYWTGKKNFGDLIGPLVVQGLTGKPVQPDRLDATGPYLLSVGSIIQTIDRPGAVIWGAGLLRPLEPRWRARLLANPIAQVTAVRGHLTRRELVEGLGLDVPEVFGDPALLLPRVMPKPAHAGGIVLCPHLSHRETFRALSAPGLRVVDVGDDPTEVIQALAGADRVISSSLHGLIVAQAYGVPWVWLRHGERPLDRSDFKFHDFFSTLDGADPAPLLFGVDGLGADALRAAANGAVRHALAVDLDRLEAALPGRD